MEGATNSSSTSSSSSSSSPVIFIKENGGGELEIDDPNNKGVRDPFIQPEGEEKDGEGIENNDQVLLLPTEKGLMDTPAKETELLKKESTKKLDDTNRILVDTAAPFESVRAAVSKFGGILGCRAEETLSIEKQKHVRLTLKKVQEEILMYQKRFRDEETAKAQVLEELDCFKRLVEGLNIRLEREETLEKQAKQDFELADLRLREVEKGIADDPSVASKAQLDVANERHTSAVAELKSTKGELEWIQAAHVSLLRERAADSVAALEGIEQTIHDDRFAAAKRLLESAHAAHLEAQEQTLVAALTLDIENLVRDELLNHAEEELQQQILMTNAMKSEFDKVSSLPVYLKGELDSRNQASLVANTKGFDEYKSIKCSKVQLSSLQSELEKEKASREGLTSTSIAFLEAEMNTEFELILNKEGPRDKTTEMEQAKLQQATKEVEEELRKAKEEAKGVEVEAARLNVTLNEIEVAGASKNWGDLDFSDGVTLPLEEYYALRKKAKELETLEEKKKALREATRRIEKAEEERLRMEHELRTYKEEHKHESTTNVGSFDDFVNIGTDTETTNSFGEADGGCQCETSVISPTGHSDTTYDTVQEPKLRKRMFFARIVMFFAGKKVRSLQ